MNNKERIEQLKETQYQELFGVKKETFELMLEILNKQYNKDHEKGGKPPKLSVLDKLLMMLCYYREYRTMQHIAFDYGVCKSTVCESVHWVEETLVKSGVFRLPSKRELHSNHSIDILLVDATEVEIERPKKTKTVLFREKEKAHLKSSDRCECRTS